MRILPISELPEDLTASWGTLVWSDRDTPFDRKFLNRVRSLGVPLASYLGLVAVEGDEVLAQVMIGHYRLTTSRGTEEISGIENVVVRPDALHRGLCTALLTEAHRRESAAGHRWAMLWTQRSWGAHRLYERLGYRDIYSPPTAVRPPGERRAPRLPKGFRLREARGRDGRLLTSLRRRSTRGRWGFRDRFSRAFPARFALGWRNAKDHHLLLYGGAAVGYFAGEENARGVEVNEALVLRPEFIPALLDGMQARARGRWLELGCTTFVADAQEQLEDRGFSLAPSCHKALMARALPAPTDRSVAELRRTAASPRFSCHRGDMF